MNFDNWEPIEFEMIFSYKTRYFMGQKWFFMDIKLISESEIQTEDSYMNLLSGRRLLKDIFMQRLSLKNTDDVEPDFRI